jgi:recombination protein RecT
MSKELITLVESQRKQFETVAVGGIEFDREAQFAMQILSGSDYLTGMALSNKSSLIAAVNNVAAIGISLNPASKLAYLVPRKGKICLDISYMGLMHIAQQTGAIKWGQAVIVRANDTFELQGIDKAPLHKFNPFATDRGEVVGCYVVVKTDENDYLTNSMPIAQIYDIRDRSEAWKAYVSKKTACPWASDPEEMIKKTVVKQASKYWPRRDRLDSAVHYLNTDGDQGIEFAKDVTPKKTSHTPNDGALEALTQEDQDSARRIANSIVDLFAACEDDKYEAAYACMYPQAAYDNEFFLGIWEALKPHSKIRSTMKRLRQVASLGGQ